VNKLCEPYLSRNQIKEAIAKIFSKKESISAKNVHSYLQENVKKRYCIIIDDAHLLNKEEFEIVERVLSVPKCSVILAGKEVKKSAKDEIGIELKKLDFAGARAMLKNRIESVDGTDIWPFSDKLVKDIFSLADYNPKRILSLCNEKSKELAIEVKQGKIQKPEHHLFNLEHEYEFKNEDVEHPKVQKKDDGFVIKLHITDDEETPAVKSAPKATDVQESNTSSKDEMPEKIEKMGNDEETESAGPKKNKKGMKEETKKEEKTEKKKEEGKTDKKKEEEKTEKKKEEETFEPIIINLGYDEKPKKAEAKPKSEPISIPDVKPVKKKK
jgi:hypothetical protein